MNNLKPPTIDAESVYESVKNRKTIRNRKILENIKTEVFERYKEYKKTSNELEKISDTIISSPEDREVMKGCYTRSDSSYLETQVIEKTITNQSIQDQNKCPYCRINKPNTIDHYLPKNQYPEYSILPINLIPCCGECNSLKGENWINDGVRIFINFYFDKIPKCKFLKAELTFNILNIKDTTNVKFIFDENSIENEYIKKILKSHYQKLNLLNIYSQYVNEEISNLYDSINDEDIESADDIYKSVKRELKMLEKNYGLNYWKAVLYRAVMDSDYIQLVFNTIQVKEIETEEIYSKLC